MASTTLSHDVVTAPSINSAQAKAGIQKVFGTALIPDQARNDTIFLGHWKLIIGNSLKIENCKLIISTQGVAHG